MLKNYLPHYEGEAKQDERNYYSSRKYNDYVKYVSTVIKDLEKIDYVEYANNDTKSSGIYNENGKLSKEQIKTLRKHLHDTDSIILSGVISFEKNFGLTCVIITRKQKHYYKENYQSFLKELDLNLKIGNGLQGYTKTQTTDIAI